MIKFLKNLLSKDKPVSESRSVLDQVRADIVSETLNSEMCEACDGPGDQRGICGVCGGSGLASIEANVDYRKFKYGIKPEPDVPKFIPSWEK